MLHLSTKRHIHKICFHWYVTSKASKTKVSTPTYELLVYILHPESFNIYEITSKPTVFIPVITATSDHEH